jgi:hypothetical protein
LVGRHRRALNDASGTDQQVYRPVLGLDALGQGLNLADIGHVDFIGMATQALRCGLRSIDLPVKQQHLRAALCQQLGAGQAYAAGRTSDDRQLLLEGTGIHAGAPALDRMKPS